MTNEMKNEINCEIRAFNKSITNSTTNKDIWDKKVELSRKYGLKIVGQYENESKSKYVKILTLKKGETFIYLQVQPKAIELDEDMEVEIVEIPIRIFGKEN